MYTRYNPIWYMQLFHLYKCFLINIIGVTPESAILEESLSHLNGKLGDLLDMAGSTL